jgi:hypothetical protein
MFKLTSREIFYQKLKPVNEKKKKQVMVHSMCEGKNIPAGILMYSPEGNLKMFIKSFKCFH